MVNVDINKDVKTIPYDERRVRDALLEHGRPSNGSLDDRIMTASDSKLYYKDSYDNGSSLQADVLKSKYSAPSEKGPLQMWDRIASALSSVESQDTRIDWYNKFMNLLWDFKFVPGGRVMHGAGREDAQRRPTLSNCYVIPIEDDSLEGIYRCLSESAMVYRTGGGVGTDLSILRPKGSHVNATIDKSPGATAFMNLFSESTNTVSQAGRRGALMLTLRVDHPDIEDFITIKNDPKRVKVEHANISTLITHEFMNAVMNDSDFQLRWNNKGYRTVKAKELWYKIIKNAHASAEPGIIFWDTMKDYHNVEYANPLSSTNPCGEQPLAAYTACNLGNLNLSKFVDEQGSFDYNGLVTSTRTATRFMDNIIDYNINNHASEKIRQAVASDRRIGLGITGLGDALVMMKIKYDTQDALNEVEKIMKVIRDESYRTSIEIAKEKGAFRLFQWEGYSKSKFVQSLPEDIQSEIKKHGIRNSTVITVPPVGTGSIVAGTSSGIEPIFDTSYRRRVKNHDGNTFSEYKVYHPLIKKMFGDDKHLPDFVVTAHDIDPHFRVKMQGVIQKYVDSSISSTINLSENVSVETIADIYMAAYKAGLKGITVYREGSREGILQTEDFAKKLAGDTLEKKVSTNGIHPEPRPRVTFGFTEMVKTGEGNLYVTVNENDNRPIEVFTTIGKAGGNAGAQSEAISRLISLALRARISPYEVIEQLRGISGPLPIWDNGTQILSTPDAIAKVLDRYMEKKSGKNLDKYMKEKSSGIPKSANSTKEPQNGNNGEENKKMTGCPECGHTIEHVSGCVQCNNCGWSLC